MLKRILVGASAGLILTASLGLAGCKDYRHQVRREAVKAHHMADGSYAFRDADGIWWWYIYANSGLARGEGTLSSPGSWRQGDAPAPAALAVSEEVDIEVSEVAGGTPVTEAAASITEAAVNATVEAGGGGSATTTGPTEASPSVPAEAGETAGGGDTGGVSE